MNNSKRVIVFRITQNCNMSCLFCSYSTEVERQRDVANIADIENFLKILSEYKSAKDQEILFSWIGGEPFLWKYIILFSEKLKENNIKVSTTTNGLALSSVQKRKDVIKYFSEIVFSLDGFSQCNDRIRQYEGHYEIVTNNILKLSEEKKEANSALIIKVNTILLKENIGDFENFCHKLIEIGVNELTFNQLGGFDRPEFYEANRLLPFQVKKFLETLPILKDKFLKLGLTIHGGSHYLERIIASTENQKISIDECNPSNWFWFINEKGFISPCSYTSYEYKYHINKIKNIETIDEIQNYFKTLRITNRSHWCDNCHCTQIYDKFE